MFYACYSCEDSARVIPICNALKDKGMTVYKGPECIAFGESYAQEMTASIESAEAVLFFYSDHAEKSLWVKKEVEFALSSGKKVIPVLLSEPAREGWFVHRFPKASAIDTRKRNTKEIVSSISRVASKSKFSKKRIISYLRVFAVLFCVLFIQRAPSPSPSSAPSDATQAPNATPITWVFVLSAFLLGGGLMFLIQKPRRNKKAVKNTTEEKTIKCFIAGSKSLQRERDALRAAASVLYNRWSSKNFRILSFTFEDFQKEHTNVPPQEMYNRFIAEEADWALFVIDGSVGGITAEEYRMAMDAYKSKGRPKVLAMARSGSSNDEKVAAIKAEIDREHQYWNDYTDIENLKYTFESALNWSLIEKYMQ